MADPVLANLSAVAQNSHRLEPVRDVLNEIYLPFPEEQLREHFAPVGTDETSADRHLDYYRNCVQAYRAWVGSRIRPRRSELQRCNTGLNDRD